MKILNNQNGGTHLVALLGVVVIAVAGFVAYRVMESSNSSSTAGTTSQSVGVPDTLKTKEDLNKASNSLDGLKVDETVDPKQLDEDIDTLL